MARSLITGKVLAPLAAGFLLSGCGVGSLFDSQPAAQVFDRDGVDVVSEPTDRRATFFKDIKSTERFCRTPGPDYAVTASEGVSLGIGLPTGGAKQVGEDAGQGALSLGGRNPEVLLAREMLYRACELSLNINADGPTTQKIYARFLKAIEAVSSSQTGTGTAGASAAAPDVKAPSISPSNSSSGSSSSSSSSDSSSDSYSDDSGSSF